MSQRRKLLRAGYSYRRLVCSYLRRQKGRSRRVRVYLYALVEVPAVYGVPRPQVRRIQGKAKPKPKPRARLRPKPKPRTRPKPKAKPKAPKVKRAAPKLETRDKWYNVADFQAAVEQQKEMGGFEISEREMEIFHSSPASDVIHLTETVKNGKTISEGEPTLFVWREKKLPIRKIVFGRKRPFRMVRIWFWVFHNEKQEYRIWCRSSTIFESTFAEAYDFAKNLFKKVSDDIAESFDYLEIHGLIAWTGYTLGERARRQDKRALQKEGGGSQ